MADPPEHHTPVEVEPRRVATTAWLGDHNFQLPRSGTSVVPAWAIEARAAEGGPPFEPASDQLRGLRASAPPFVPAARALVTPPDPTDSTTWLPRLPETCIPCPMLGCGGRVCGGICDGHRMAPQDACCTHSHPHHEWSSTTDPPHTVSTVGTPMGTPLLGASSRANTKPCVFDRSWAELNESERAAAVWLGWKDDGTDWRSGRAADKWSN